MLAWVRPTYRYIYATDVMGPLSSLTFLFLACVRAAQIGTATWYGAPWDTYQLSDGTCSCSKADLYKECYNGKCFTSITAPYFTAAINTIGLNNTRLCGECVHVRCTKGLRRGKGNSTYGWDDPCREGQSGVTVMITDSCPSGHSNPSNQFHCHGNTTHFDLSSNAFHVIADMRWGVIDVEWWFTPCPTEIWLGPSMQDCCKDGRKCFWPERHRRLLHITGRQ